MGKESIVEIPKGSGHKYRYEYQDGQTVYKGPVGDSPELGEEQFLAELVHRVEEWPEMESAIKDLSRSHADTEEWFQFFKDNYLEHEFDMMLKGYDHRGEKREHTGTKAYPLVTDRFDEHTIEIDPGFNDTYVMKPIGTWDKHYIVGEKKDHHDPETFKIIQPLRTWNFVVHNEKELLAYVKRSWAGED